MVQVVIQREMTYDGIKRYKGEIMALHGARNDDKLVRNNLVRIFDEEHENCIRADNLGRDFTTEESLRVAQRDVDFAPLHINSETGEGELPGKLKPGRPKGSKDKKPRKKAAAA